MFRRFVGREVVTVIVVYADNILLTSKTMGDEERPTSDLRPCFRIKDLGEPELPGVPYHKKLENKHVDFGRGARTVPHQ